MASQLGPPRIATYGLRDSGLAVTIRHGSRDVAILNEIFGGTSGVRSYEPPPGVAAWLDALTSPTVMDLGANIGLFGLYALGRWPDAEVIAFEPEPDNAALLDRTIVANGLERQWRVRRCACSNEQGVVGFVAGGFSESRIAEEGEAAAIDVPMVDLFAEHHDVDLLKMDIEGGEWAILADPRMHSLGARAVVLEWHMRNCVGPDPHAAAARLLRDAGYTRTHDVGGPNGRHHDGVMWAWRPEFA